MPAKLIPTDNYFPLSSLHRQQHIMPELNNNSPAALVEISNPHNFVDFLYVFENSRPLPPNPPTASEIADREARLEFMNDIFDDDTDAQNSKAQHSKARSKIDNDKFNFKHPDQDASSLRRVIELRSSKEKSVDENDLMSDLDMREEDEESDIFSPALLNGKKYKPVHGLHYIKLYNGSRFVGYQKTKHNCYGVEVIINYADFENLSVCGHLSINGLTEEYPTLTTFFDGEIISERYPFLTRKYDANSEVDKNHRARLIPSKQFARMFNDEYDYSKIRNSNFVFMRWKERHLVKDHKINEINGCSFAGFYYILFSKI